MNKHQQNCSAPICVECTEPSWKEKHIWIPGECICTHRPLTAIQKKQIEINKLVEKNKFKPTKYYTGKELEEGCI